VEIGARGARRVTAGPLGSAASGRCGGCATDRVRRA
jgi:hypothetical protein